MRLAMFFPLRDDNPTRIVPWVNYTLIFANVAAFWLIRRQGAVREELALQMLGLVPLRFVHDPVLELPTVFSSMFMHGSWLHLLSNVWSLKIFGDNLEERFGRARYLGFYLISGIVAAAAQILVDLESAIPMVGASGAIAGVIGAYIVLYPRAPIHSFVMVPLMWPFMGPTTVVPAWVIAFLFLVQNLMLALQSASGLGSAGVAFAAHLGGFAAGLALVWPFAARAGKREAWRVPNSFRARDSYRRW
jgi:membrane associated rhomboid family serine protease